jgi:hypothetical protein
MAILAECPFCHRMLTVKSKKCSSSTGKVCGADPENLQAKRKTEALADPIIDQELTIAGAVINKGFDNDFVSGDTLKAFKKVKKLLMITSFCTGASR